MVKLPGLRLCFYRTACSAVYCHRLFFHGLPFPLVVTSVFGAGDRGFLTAALPAERLAEVEREP